MRSAIIFGSAGQDGLYMRQTLESRGITVISCDHRQCPVDSPALVEIMIEQVRPDYIFHFAAVSSTKHEALIANHLAIVDGTVNILRAAEKHTPRAKVFLSGSILQFQGEVVSTDSPLSYESAYSAQRHASVAMGRYYRTRGMRVYIGYFAHHDSPNRPATNLAQRIATTVKRMTKDSKLTLSINDWNDVKEWNFAGDTMAAVWALVNSPIYEAVIGCGQGYRIADFIDACYKATDCDLSHETRTMVFQTRDPKILITNPKELDTMGFVSRYSMTDLARMMVSAASC